MWVTGTHSEMQYVKGDPDDGSHEAAMGNPSLASWTNRPHASADPSCPRRNSSRGQRGESRRSYHGYPKGYAQLQTVPTTGTLPDADRHARPQLRRDARRC